MEQDSPVDKEDWQQKVRNVDASLHAAFAAQKREASRKKPRLKAQPAGVPDGLKRSATAKPISSSDAARVQPAFPQ